MSKSFANKILELRTQKNISQRELGEAIGVSNLSIFNYEKGTKKPRRNTLIKIAEYFNVPVEYFNEEQYEPMRALVSIVSAGGAASSNTFKYRVNLSNKWMQIMGISREDKLVDLLYRDKTIIIEKAGTGSDFLYEEKTTVTVKISSSGGGATPGTERYMVVLLNKWMQMMQITTEDRTVELMFDGKKITITKV